MKLLIIGDALSQFVSNFSKELKKKYGDTEIDIINYAGIETRLLQERVKGIYGQVYNFQPWPGGIINKIPKIRGWVAKREANKHIRALNSHIENYDVILLHGFWIANQRILDRLNADALFKVGAFWGGDFYDRQLNNTEHVVASLLSQMDRVCISTKNMEEDILSVYSIPEDKIRNCLFGLKPLDNLFASRDITAQQAKVKMGFKEDDIIITCGYNACENMQHQEMIRALIANKEHFTEKHKVIFPLTYGDYPKGYIVKIKEEAEKAGITCRFLESFLSDDEVTMLRKATGIFIQVQMTDAYSGSMLEHLFAQNIVITGAWLPYTQLKEKQVYFEEIADVTQLSGKLGFVLQHLDELKEKAEQYNTNNKFNSSLWQFCIEDWYNMLIEYKQTNYGA